MKAQNFFDSEVMLLLGFRQSCRPADSTTAAFARHRDLLCCSRRRSWQVSALKIPLLWSEKDLAALLCSPNEGPEAGWNVVDRLDSCCAYLLPRDNTEHLTYTRQE